MAMILAFLVTYVIILAVCFSIWLIFACQYKSKVTDKRQAFTQGDQSQLQKLEPGNICGCCGDMQVCLHSCCCMDVRAADTFSTSGLASFWTVIIIIIVQLFAMEVLTVVFQFVFSSSMNSQNAQNISQALGWCITAIPVAVWFAQKRAEFRKKFGGSGNQVGMDFVCYWCCQPCSIGADAMAMDAAQGVHVECCCNMVNLNPGQGGTVVGMPVNVGGQKV